VSAGEGMPRLKFTGLLAAAGRGVTLAEGTFSAEGGSSGRVAMTDQVARMIASNEEERGDNNERMGAERRTPAQRCTVGRREMTRLSLI
jgi:hypothetical protein